MKNEVLNQNLAAKKPFRKRYSLLTLFLALLVSSIYVFAVFTWEPKPDTASEKVIREASAIQLGKDPNELTDDDFTKILEMELLGKDLCDIILLEKFINLKKLYLIRIVFPGDRIPKWMKILDALGVSGPKNRFAFNLSPLEKLDNLKTLLLINCDTITDKQIEELQKVLPELEICRGEMLV